MADFVKVEIIDNSFMYRTDFNDAVKRALETCGLKAEGYASGITPVDTGRLRASITHTVKGNGAKVYRYRATETKESFEENVGAVSEDDNSCYVGTNVEYAPIIELGGGKRKAHHFLKKSIQDHQDEYIEIIQKELKGK